jgi:hypothetical protein
LVLQGLPKSSVTSTITLMWCPWLSYKFSSIGPLPTQVDVVGFVKKVSNESPMTVLISLPYK